MIPPLLRDRVFRRYWGASTISMSGDQISGVALPLAAVLALHALTLAQLLAVTFAAGGPSAGGVLVQVLSAPFAIVADALSFLGSAFFLSRISPAEPAADQAGGPVLAGARFIARSGVVRASLVAAATINFFNLMFFALALLFAVRELHLRAGWWG